MSTITAAVVTYYKTNKIEFKKKKKKTGHETFISSQEDTVTKTSQVCIYSLPTVETGPGGV